MKGFVYEDVAINAVELATFWAAISLQVETILTLTTKYLSAIVSFTKDVSPNLGILPLPITERAPNYCTAEPSLKSVKRIPQIILGMLFPSTQLFGTTPELDRTI